MPDIITVAGIVEPLRMYNYKVTLTRAPGGLDGVLGLEWRAIRCPIPEHAFESIEIWTRWFKWYVQGLEGGGKTLEITWWEGEDLAIYNALWEWRNIVGDWLTGRQGMKQDISGELEITFLGGDESELGTVRVMNVFPITINPIELAYGENRVVEVTATFQFDWMERV